jgi:energy-coupling factor transport system ATP-binding protein
MRASAPRPEAGPAPARVASLGEPLVVFEDVSFGYGEGPDVLHHVNLEIRCGETIALLGPNGVGKSTLVKHAIGLLKPRRGRVRVEGQDTRECSVAQIAHTLGYVFQSPGHMLFATTVHEELAFGPRTLRMAEAEVTRNVNLAVAMMGLGGLEKYPPLALSYGQQKRVTIAAVVSMRSKILVLDEPTAGQDYGHYMRFMDSICGSGERSLDFDAILFITHDLDLAISYANRVILMREGCIAGDGAPEAVLSDTDLLEGCRLVPTSLLEENKRLLPRTGRFGRVESLIAYA